MQVHELIFLKNRALSHPQRLYSLESAEVREDHRSGGAGGASISDF